MSDPAILEAERILFCNWNENGGRLEYDISHLHPELDLLTQSYLRESPDYEGNRIYGSEFLVFKRGEIAPSILGSEFSKQVKVALWQLTFAIKRNFFDEVQPDIVQHFIKWPHSVEQRFMLYTKYLALPDYLIEKSRHEITYTRKTSLGDEGGFLVFD